MAYTQEITGASGTVTIGGSAVSYSATATDGTLDSFSAGFGVIDGTNYYLGNTSPEVYNFSFGTTISGFQMRINAQDASEVIDFTINGVDVSLNDLIADGRLTVVSADNGTVNAAGDLTGSANPSNGAATTLEFNMPIDTFSLAHTGGASGSLVEILVDDVPAPPPLNYIVEGTSGDDLIDAAYAGDPQGDMVDANDNLAGSNDDSIVAGAGNDSVFSGAGADTIDGGDGNDTIDGNDGDDLISGGTGNDTLHGNAGNDTLNGGAGIDSLYGGDGDDLMDGGDDADELVGGSGNDSMLGGGGNDFVYGDFGDDTIFGGDGDDWVTGKEDDDLVYGDAGNDTVVGGLGTDTLYGGTGDDLVTGEEGDDLGYGEDGNDNMVGGEGSDTLFGGIGSDTIDGGIGDDSLYGEEGDDSINGGTGNDSIEGGDGNDRMRGAEGLDTLQGGDGDDTLQGGDDNDALYGGIGNDNMSGDEGDDLLYGNEGDDRLDGGAGTDTIYGGAGNDSVIARDGDDYVEGGDGADFIEGNAGNDTVLAGADNDTVIAGTGDDSVNAGAGADSVSGGDGNDSIDGQDGNDILDGGNDNDTIYAGSGDDTIYGGDGDDLIIADAGRDLVYGGGGNDRIIGGNNNGEYAVPGDANGNAPGADTLDGGAGNDYLGGNNGDDLLIGGEGDDTLNGDAHNDTLLGGTGRDALNGGDGNDSLDGGSDDDTLDGGTGNDALIGGDGNDSLLGNTGNDTLSGGTGDDTLLGGAGDDLHILENGFGNDTITGGETGETNGDTLDLSAVTDDITIDLRPGDSEAGTVYDGTDTAAFSEIENIILGSGRDTILLTDGSGADSVTGFAAPTDNLDSTYTGNDRLDVSSMTIDGTNPVKANHVVVTADVDGNAVLTFPGGESLTLVGVAPSEVDSIAELTAMGIPGPVDGTSGDDTIAAGYVDTDGDQVDGTDGINDTIYGYDGDDRINGEGGDDSIEGGAGNDTLDGGLGDDILSGGDDEDLFEYQSNGGADTIIGGEGGSDFDTLAIDSVTANVNVMFTSDGGGAFGVSGVTSIFSEIEAVRTAAGNDFINANADTTGLSLNTGLGNDEVIGGSGDDLIYGDNALDSEDVVRGNPIANPGGNDTLSGGDGNDSIYGGSGDDSIYGGDGDDSLIGGHGNDLLEGGDGNDHIEGLYGDDTIYGGAGDDHIFGRDGADLIFGGDGNDTLIGSIGIDTIYGGTGNDIIAGSQGSDLIYAGEGNDLVFIGVPASGDIAYDNEGIIYLEDGNDFLDGGDATLRFEAYGGTGNDIINAGVGDDTLSGGADNDRIFAGAGNDQLNGNEGDDSIEGQSGDDTISLTDSFGNDTIVGGETGETDGDTLDLSAVTANLTVDLTANNPEAGSVTNGTDTATFSEIENIVLGAGTDTLVLADGSGNDTVSGFAAPVNNGDGTFTGNDQLDVTNLTDAGGDPVNTADVTVSDTNGDGTGDAILTFPGGESITLLGVTVAEVNTPLALTAIGIPAGPNYIVEGTAGADLIDVTYTADPQGDRVDNSDALDGSQDDVIVAGDGNDTINAGAGDDTVQGGAGDDSILGGTGDDVLTGGAGANTATGGAGNDVFVYEAGETLDITDFGTGSTDTDDNNQGNNDFINLADYYTNVAELKADLADDGVLNQSVGDYTDNTSLAGGSITGLGALGGQSSTSVFDQTNVVCFARGTLIKTKSGEVLIENLLVGDLVLTMDNGYQPLRWIGCRKLDLIDLTHKPALKPVRITAGALGSDLPASDLRVSPQHRILTQSIIAERMFGENEVLIPAIKLVALEGIYQERDAQEVEYFHMLFEQHEIVFSNGAATESLFTGPEALKGISPEARAEIVTLFPEINSPDYAPSSARYVPTKGSLVKRLVRRHMKNGKVIVDSTLP